MVLCGGTAMEESLEKIIYSKPIDLVEEAISCANSCQTSYRAKVGGYRVCTLSQDNLCKYSANDLVNSFHQVGIQINPEKPLNWYPVSIVDRYQKCSKGLMPVSEIYQKLKTTFAVKLVKGHFVW